MANQETNLARDDQMATSLEVASEIVAVEPNPLETMPPNRVSNLANELASTKNVARAALIGATLVTLAFEQSPANEAVRVSIALNALENTGSAVLAGGAVAAATMAIEGSTSAVIAVGLHKEQETVRRITGRFKKKSTPELDDNGIAVEKPRALSTKTADLAIALGIGPAIAMTKRHIEDNDPTLRNDLKRGLSYSAIGATVSGGVGYLVTGGIQQAEAIGLEEPAEYVIEYGTDLRFWGGVLAVIYGFKGIKKLVNKARNPEQGARG